MKSFFRITGFYGVGLLVLVAILAFYITIKVDSATTVLKVENCKVLDLQQQQLINKTSTDIRYLVITDKETFIVQNSLLNGKFNNSDLFFRLKKGSVYEFRVSGKGKSFFLDYRNILDAKKIK